MDNDTRIAVDLAKSVFEVAVSSAPGTVTERHRLSRAQFARFFVQRPPATIVMEACGSAHHWGRELQRLGHRVVLLAPQQVRPYVVRNKTDRTDAAGMLEVYRNAEIRPVPVKSVAQQTLAALHRLRSAWLAQRTAQSERQLDALAHQLPLVDRLRSIPGVGLLTATALEAAVGDARRFPSGRHFASYLGLTPREHPSGARHRLGAISKRGDVYLRMLLIHGARATLWHAKRLESPDRLRAWALRLEQRVGHNKAAVALANKLARIVWAVWTHAHDFAPVAHAA